MRHPISIHTIESSSDAYRESTSQKAVILLLNADEVQTFKSSQTGLRALYVRRPSVADVICICGHTKSEGVSRLTAHKLDFGNLYEQN